MISTGIQICAKLEAEEFGYLKSCKYFACHGAIEGVEFIGSIELNRASTIVCAKLNIVRIVARFFSIFERRS